jgi:class 3 adenylate cyclase
MLDCFRESFHVTTLHWPSVRGGPEAPPTWQGVAKTVRDQLPPGGHFVSIRGNVTIALLAIQEHSALPRSIVCDGIDLPSATFEALGMEMFAHAVETAHRLDIGQQQWLRVLFEDVDEVAVRAMIAGMIADADHPYVEQFERDIERVNLLETLGEVSVPALYIETGTPYPGWTERREIFARFVPNTEFDEQPPWRFHDPESGRGFAARAIPFLLKHSARTVLANVLFADIVDSTVQTATLGDRRWSQVPRQFHATAERELKRSRGKLVDTAGDGFMAVFDDPAAAIECAASVTAAVRELGLETRAGVHTGQAEVSGEKYSGVAVHTAARVCAKAAPGEVLVSETVRQLLAGSALAFEERGIHELKGLPAPVPLYAAALD